MSIDSQEFNSEIHVTFLDLVFQDTNTGQETKQKWAHAAYFITSIDDEVNRRKLIRLEDGEFDELCSFFNSPIHNGEMLVIYYHTNNSLKLKLTMLNPFGEELYTSGGSDCAFIYGTSIFKEINDA